MLKRKDLRKVNLEKKIAIHNSYLSEKDKKNNAKNNIQKNKEQYTEVTKPVTPVIDETELTAKEEVVDETELTAKEEVVDETELTAKEEVEKSEEEIKDKKNK